jgi:hypothetical protein
MMPEYSTGISQPPNSTILAPNALCTALNAVRFKATPVDVANLSPPSDKTRQCKSINLTHSQRSGQGKPPRQATNYMRMRAGKEGDKSQNGLNHQPHVPLPANPVALPALYFLFATQHTFRGRRFNQKTFASATLLTSKTPDVSAPGEEFQIPTASSPPGSTAVP